MTLKIINQEKIDDSFLERYILRIEKEFDDINQEINVVFVNSKYIKGLNKEYRGIDKVTDVLSFSINEEALLGEIYICPEYVEKEIEFPFEEEIVRLIIHGILHLLGYDHTVELNENTKISEEMFVKQEKILQNVIS